METDCPLPFLLPSLSPCLSMHHMASLPGYPRLPHSVAVSEHLGFFRGAVFPQTSIPRNLSGRKFKTYDLVLEVTQHILSVWRRSQGPPRTTPPERATQVWCLLSGVVHLSRGLPHFSLIEIHVPSSTLKYLKFLFYVLLHIQIFFQLFILRAIERLLGGILIHSLKQNLKNIFSFIDIKI